MKKILKILILILFNILILIKTSIAADGFYKINLIPNKTEVTKGESFFITIEIDPSAVEGGIGAYLAEIKYDSTLFEISKLEGLGNWENPIMNNGKIIATTNDGECVTTKQEIAKITFIAKADVINTTSEIKVENFQASNAENIKTAENENVEIGINRDTSSQNQGQESISSEQKTDINNSNALSNSILPFAGIKNTIIPIVLIIMFILIFVTYILSKKNKNK